MKRLVSPLLALTIASLAGRALAESTFPAVDVRGFHPPTDPAGALCLEPALTPGGGAFNASAVASFADRPAVVRRDGEVVGKLLRYQLSTDLIANIGVGSRMAFGATLPLVVLQSTEHNDATRSVLARDAVRTAGVGDLALTAKVNLLSYEMLGGFGLAALARASFPTGQGNTYVSEKSTAGELRMLAEYKLVAVSVQATAGLSVRGHEVEMGDVVYGKAIPWGIGVMVQPRAFGLDDQGRMTWHAELHGAQTLAPFSTSEDFDPQRPVSPLYVSLSSRFAFGETSLLVGAESSLNQSFGSAPLRLVAGLQWAPRTHDRDHDGVPDDKDECPDLAEDRDGYQDEDGCPDWDNDDDGVPDASDRCPKEKEDVDEFQDDDGCPDPDNDGDGILDSDDACPNEKGPRTSQHKTNGCPAKAGAPK